MITRCLHKILTLERCGQCLVVMLLSICISLAVKEGKNSPNFSDWQHFQRTSSRYACEIRQVNTNSEEQFVGCWLSW